MHSAITFLILLFMATPLFANTTKIQSKHLRKSITDVEIRLGDDYYGPTAFGRINGSEIKLLGHIETNYTSDSSVFSIKMISVEKEAQGKGVAHVLVEFALRRQEQFSEVSVTKITASSYVGGNLDPYLARFIFALRHDKDFKKTDKTKPYQERFKQCCSKIYKNYPELIEKMVNYVPSFRMGKQLGFKMCPNTLEFKVPAEANKDIYLNFDMCIDTDAATDEPTAVMPSSTAI